MQSVIGGGNCLVMEYDPIKFGGEIVTRNKFCYVRF